MRFRAAGFWETTREHLAPSRRSSTISRGEGIPVLDVVTTIPLGQRPNPRTDTAHRPLRRPVAVVHSAQLDALDPVIARSWR